MQTVLAKIVADKAIWVETRKQQQPLASFQNEVQPSTRHFYDALQGARTAFILECKKASPSKGVFRNHDIADVVDKAKVLSLAAVQLHGNEDQLYIDTLREALPAHVAIWKALSVGETLPAREFQHVDKYVLDNGQGGSGQRFDWSLLNGQSLGNVLLAGGLGADNCVEAAQTGCAGLDFNSAVESQPGIKDARLLASVFQTLRAY